MHVEAKIRNGSRSYFSVYWILYLLSNHPIIRKIPAKSIIPTPMISNILRTLLPADWLFFRNAVPSIAVRAIVNPIPELITTALRTPSVYIPKESENKKMIIVPGQGTMPAPSINIKSVEFEVV